ncbi:hypothetical protein AAIA72_15150 [Hahella sp. SMD15-11]|uniref:Phosphate ABC transporter substrate-binding protein n=1 Tax=Thermohahella caldifontis TaxID=3142973 RepID=A0AB39UV08_9GAMM
MIRTWRWIILTLLMVAGSVQADIYVVVHRDSPLTRVTPELIRDLYLARVQSLPSGERLIPVDRADEALRARFIESLIGMDVRRFDAYWARLVFAGRVLPPVKVESEDQLSGTLSERPTAVGYTDRPPASAELRTVLVIPG